MLDGRYEATAATFGMLAPAGHLFDEHRGTGRIRAAVERPHYTTALLEFERDHVLVQWGELLHHYGGEYARGTADGVGRVVVIDNGGGEYYVMGFDSRVTFRPAPGTALPDGPLQGTTVPPLSALHPDEAAPTCLPTGAGHTST